MKGKSRTVVLAAGDFPRRGGVAWRVLESAARVIACDGAATAYRRRFGKWPTVVVGDLDSVGRLPADCEMRICRVADQDSNDLEKALDLCAAEGWRSPVVLGATGRRDDHTLGNLSRAMSRGVEIVTGFGRFIPLAASSRTRPRFRRFRVRKGRGLSVFALDPATAMRSRGLVWTLDGVRLAAWHTATLNRAAASTIALATDRPAYLYLPFETESKEDRP